MTVDSLLFKRRPGPFGQSNLQMRVKLTFDGSIGLPHEFQHVWFYVDSHQQQTISDCEREIRTLFNLKQENIALRLDGFRLLSHQKTSVMLTEECSISVWPAKSTLPMLELAPPERTKRSRDFDTLEASGSSHKSSRLSETHEAPRNSTISSLISPKKRSKTQQSTSASSSSSTSSSSSESSSSSSETSSKDISSDYSSDSSSSESEKNDSPQTSLLPSPNLPNEDSSDVFQKLSAITQQLIADKARRKRQQTAQRRARAKANNDTVQSISRVYINHLEDLAVVPQHYYDSLPTIALNEVAIGQIVAWRMFCLSPTKSPGSTPWQERQLVTVSPDGLTFRSHNLNAYLSSWWLDDEGEKICTVREWLLEDPSANPSDITIPLDSEDITDLRLLHSADVDTDGASS